MAQPKRCLDATECGYPNRYEVDATQRPAISNEPITSMGELRPIDIGLLKGVIHPA